ncbi:Flp pilus assembly protein CpaB [Rhodobacteraceae bacterium 2376]|uniref:Flp pilus assembly protein CpaB n=1 Tax=Rhabdonatronobacter sediminivivens TaxID=2743469 RepID=A0A7Z0I099_9RHOB|nr:Flp pilus assembly protein CpaB [Rhabdonatronobacter sediminivivens]NYS25495.1 Flp pilus assembly protein CpaB [Rhabdonatronobacter sediminivivens]
MMRFAILVLSLGSGSLATALMIDSGDSGQAVASITEPEIAVPMREVLVAGTDLAHGDVVTSNTVRWQSWPEFAVGSALLVRDELPDAPTELTGKFVRGGFSAGEPIRIERLVENDARLLSSNLPEGRRALALRVSAESTAGGFVLPNDRVDVLLTSTENTDGRRGAASRVIARNIRVLAIDQLVDRADADAVVGNTATLELAEGQVEVVLAAAASGMLSLALRSAADHHLIEPEPEVSPIREEAVPLASVAEPKDLPRTVRVRRGTEVETVAFQ